MNKCKEAIKQLNCLSWSCSNLAERIDPDNFYYSSKDFPEASEIDSIIVALLEVKLHWKEVVKPLNSRGEK